MAAENKRLVGVIKETPPNGIQILGKDGVVREVTAGDHIYEGDQLISADAQAVVAVKYLALSKTTTYEGVFNILVNDSIASKTDESESSSEIETFPIENINNVAATKQNTQIWNTSSFSKDHTPYQENYNDFDKNKNTELQTETKESETKNLYSQNIKAPLDITSSNIAIFDEDAQGVIVHVTATESIPVKYSIDNSLDGALFTIDSATGALRFMNSPDYDAPLDLDLDNEYTLKIIATDDAGNFTTQLVSVYINNINDAPVAVEDVDTAGENELLTIDVLANDTDVDSSSLTLNNVSITANTHSVGYDNLKVTVQATASIVDNKLVFNQGDEFDYLSVGETATVVIGYEIQDDSGLTSTSTATITITGTNDAPIAVADSDTIVENELLTMDVLANDTDIDSSSLTLNSVAITTNTHSVGFDASTVTTQAAVSVVDNKLVFNQGDEFDYLTIGETAMVVVNYEMQDEGGLTSTSTATITITGTNDAPIAVADIDTILENESLTIDVLANDTDIDSSNFSLNSASISTNTHSAGYDDSSVTTHATVSIVNNKLVFNQGDEFDYLSVGETATVVVNYEIQDDGGLTSTSTATITITGTNDAPTAVADNLNNHYVDLSNTPTSNIVVADSNTINLDRKDNFSVSISVDFKNQPDVLDTIFSKGDAFSLRVSNNKLLFTMATEEFSIVENADGSIGFDTETINTGDSFHDTNVSIDLNTINNITFSYDGINVTIINSDGNGNLIGMESIPYTGTVVDPEYLGNELTIGDGADIIIDSIVGPITMHGNLNATVDNITMEVENQEVLNIDFENGASDIHGNTVTLGNDAELLYKVISEDIPLIINTKTLLANDTDIDGDTLSIVSIQGATHGTVVLSADGSTITFTPETNYSGNASFTYTMSDGNGMTSTTSASFNIESVNDAPVAIGESITKIADERSYTISPPIIRAFTYLGSESLTSNINDFDTDNSRHATYNSNILVLDDNLYYTYTNSAGGTAVDLFYPTDALETTVHDDGDSAEHIDSIGYYNEGVIFDFAREVDSIIIKIDPTSQITDDDNVEVRVYSDTSNTSYLLANFNATTQTYSIGQTGFGIKRIAIFAKDGTDAGQTEFRIQSVTGTYTESKTLDVFTIDKGMLLANDTDVESSILSLKLGDGILYDASNVAIGTVSLNAQGDITVTPNAHFDATDFAYPKTHVSTHFSYSVVDAEGKEGNLVTTTVNVKVGTDTSDGVTFTQGDPVVTLEGLTITTKPVDTMIIGTEAKDTFSINGTIDLSNVSSIEGFELNNSTAKLIGSGIDGAITLSDVISATDSSNDLIINASDHNASDQIVVDSSFTKKEGPVTQDGSVYDLYYGSNGTTLLVEIHQEL